MANELNIVLDDTGMCESLAGCGRDRGFDAVMQVRASDGLPERAVDPYMILTDTVPAAPTRTTASAPTAPPVSKDIGPPAS